MSMILEARGTQTPPRAFGATLRTPILGRSEVLSLEIDGAATAGRWASAAKETSGTCIHVHLQRVTGYEMRDAKGTYGCSTIESGSVIAYDLARAPMIRCREATRIVSIWIPDEALVVVADELRAAVTGPLDIDSGQPFYDDRMRTLAQLLLMGAADTSPCGSFYMGQVALALIVHLATARGGMVDASELQKGGLAPWQTKRAQQLMTARLDAEISLADVAQECGLSLSHFSRAFRQAVGASPHAWLMRRRVDAAKSMMHTDRLPLSEIALACGFADQSHFTRVFSRETGASPGQWRRCLVA